MALRNTLLQLTSLAVVSALGCGDDGGLNSNVSHTPDAMEPVPPDATTDAPAPADAMSPPDAVVPPDAMSPADGSVADAQPVNTRPTAVVADQTANVGALVTLSGTASSDPDGDVLGYRWTLRNVPPLSDAVLDSVTASSVRFEADRAGVYAVDLVVNDGVLDSTTATALVTVYASDQAPVASAGPDRTLRIGTTAYLSARGSRDPRGLNLFYGWELISRPATSTAVLDSEVTRDVYFRADVAGDYVVELFVHNGSRPSQPDLVTITAVDVPDPIPGDVAGGVFNPDEVYLFGTLSEGACYLDAVAHWSEPDVAVAGFDCYADERSVNIRNDGIALYSNTFEDKLREFHCDGCPDWEASDAYPSNVLANDTVLPTPACDMFRGLGSFTVGVAGQYVYSCSGRAGWFDELGTELPLTTAPLTIGFGGKTLTATSTAAAIVDLATGASIPVTGLPNTSFVATRAASPTEFWVVISTTAASVQRWRIGGDGAATLDGTYPAVPAGYTAQGYGGKLDAGGNLLQIGGGPVTFEDVIVRRSVNGLSEVVYTEATNPAVQIHISGLFTGP